MVIVKAKYILLGGKAWTAVSQFGWSKQIQYKLYLDGQNKYNTGLHQILSIRQQDQNKYFDTETGCLVRGKINTKYILGNRSNSNDNGHNKYNIIQVFTKYWESD